MTIRLPAATLANVDEGLRKLHDMIEDFDKAEKCGVECTPYREFHKVLLENLTAIKREFNTPGK